MRILFPMLLTFILCACNNSSSVKRAEIPAEKSFSEDIEWSQTWMVSVNSQDLPKVLIIGDSHVERYYPAVAARLQNKAYCSKFTTSRSLGDPALMEQLKTIFFSFKFNVISFNNGLHGVEYSDEQYSRYIPDVYRLFTGSNPGVKLIWVNTTGRRVRDSIGVFDEYNRSVIIRNKSVENFTIANGIPLLDFYSLSVSHPEYYESDGIHFNKEGVEEEARNISDEIIKIIESSNFTKK
jgi:hypothetical protein